MPRSRSRAAPSTPEPLDEGARRVLWCLVAAVLFLHVAATFVSSNWLWGVDLGRYVPRPVALLLAALAIAGLLPATAGRIGTALARLGAAWERGGWPWDLAVSVACGIALFWLRDSLRFVGDFDLRVAAIDYQEPPSQLFPQASPLDVAINFTLPRALLGAGRTPAIALQSVGAMMGGSFVFCTLGLLRAAGARGAALACAALTVLAGGFLQHFAGYDKFGPLLLGIALGSWGAIRLARRIGGEILLAAGAAICVLAHRSGYLALPPALWVMGQAWRADPRRRTRVIAAGAALLAISLAPLPAVWGILESVDLSAHLPGGAVARSYQSPDAPGALVRLSDLLNALFFLAPLWPLGAAMLAWRERAAPAQRGRFSLLLPALSFVALQGILLGTVGATRGSGRDWDAAAPLGVMVAIATAVSLIPAWSARGRPALAPACLALVVATGLLAWGPHVSARIGLARAHERMTARPRWSDTARAHALDFLGLRALTSGAYDEAADLFQQAINVAPNPRYFEALGLAHAGAGRRAEARAAFSHSAVLDPVKSDPWVELARLSLADGDSLGALAETDSALARNPGEREATDMRRAIETARAR